MRIKKFLVNYAPFMGFLVMIVGLVLQHYSPLIVGVTIVGIGFGYSIRTMLHEWTSYKED